MIRSLPTVNIIPESSDAIRIASSGSATDLQALIKSGTVSPTDRSADGWTLLMNATYYGKREVMDFLVRIKAALAAREDFGRQAVHFAIIRSFCVGASEMDKQQYLRFPNWRDAWDEFDFTSIHAAALGNYPPDDKERPPLAALIEFSDSLNNLPPRPNWSKIRSQYSGRSLLFIGVIDLFRKAECEQRQVLGSKFYKVYVDLINECDALQRWTPFHWATYAGRDDSMRTLLQHGANPFVTTPMGRNSLHQAAESTRPAIVKIILDIPPDPGLGWFDIDLQDIWGETPLHIAIYRQSPELVRRLLDKGARRDLPTKDGGYVPLHYAANLAPGECQNELVRLLSADGGPHINAPDDNGCPPLFSLLGNPVAFKILLRASADLGLLDRDGLSVIHHACAGNYTESLDILLSSPLLPRGLPLQPNKAGDIPLAHAIKCQSIAAAKRMLKAFGPGDLVFKNGRSLVHRAIEAGDADFLDACFQEPSFRRGTETREGWTTKQLAARLGRFEGKIKDLILQYESYSRTDREISQAEIRAQARMDYFAIIR
ncbi:ankyrin repeat protein [Fusarium austroafricanum]|uniref:Ankyrin repeat protein n=1 Tax=Fusarium austroafricanum TaxID=2364996 RepID=A0A8H4NXL7_9HYPO|nr:ankyrin repeat protein [Fusarium austroafricanum]